MGGVALAQGALSASSNSSAAKAQAAAQRRRNASLESAANQTKALQTVNQKYAYRMQKESIGEQSNATVAAILASSAARGILGSRTGVALEDSTLGQAGKLLEDAAVSDLFARAQIDLTWANTMNQRGGYAGINSGLNLLNAGLTGLSGALSAYGALGPSDPTPQMIGSPVSTGVPGGIPFIPIGYKS